MTGGGATLKHIEQLTQFITGMDTRIGFPNEHLSANSADEMTKPMYSTGIGLVLMGMQRPVINESPNQKETPGKPETPPPPPPPVKSHKVSEWFDRFFRDGIS